MLFVIVISYKSYISLYWLVVDGVSAYNIILIAVLAVNTQLDAAVTYKLYGRQTYDRKVPLLYARIIRG